MEDRREYVCVCEREREEYSNRLATVAVIGGGQLYRRSAYTRGRNRVFEVASAALSRPPSVSLLLEWQRFIPPLLASPFFPNVCNASMRQTRPVDAPSLSLCVCANATLALFVGDGSMRSWILLILQFSFLLRVVS